MPIMASPWKNPDTGIYYIRRRIPKELQQIINRGSFWKKSLGTREFSEACERFAVAYTESTEAFKVARAELAGLPIVKPSDAPRLADRWARAVMSEWETTPESITDFLALVTVDGEERYTQASTILDGDTAQQRSNVVSGFLRTTLQAHNLPLPGVADPTRLALETAFYSRWCDLCNMALERQHGDWGASLKLVAADKPLAVEVRSEETTKPPLLSEALESWAKQKAALDPGSDKTIGTFSATINRFIDLFGDLPLSQIKRQQVNEFAALLLKIPTQGAGLRKLTAREAIARGEAEELPTASLATVKNQLRHIEAILNHAKATHENIIENPVTASGIIKRLNQSMKRRPTRFADEKHYSRRDLKIIFTSPLFADEWTPPRADYGKALYWLPLIMLYTGARREEIAKLYAGDVAKDPDCGVWHLRIRTIDDETVKTGNSQRKIPIHQDLIDLGFLIYRDSLPVGSRLFPKLENSKDGYGHSVGKKWAEYLREVVKLDSQASPSHGFRHTFKTLCREVQISKEVSDWVTGHASANEGDNYGDKPLVRMRDELKKFPSIAREVGLLPPVETTSPPLESPAALVNR